MTILHKAGRATWRVMLPLVSVTMIAVMFAHRPERARAQAPGADPGGAFTQSVIRPTATVIQFDMASMIAGFGALGGGIGVGFRSAAKIMREYLENRDKDESKRVIDAEKTNDRYYILTTEVAKALTKIDGTLESLPTILDRLDTMERRISAMEDCPAARHRRRPSHPLPVVDEKDGSKEHPKAQ